MFRLIFRLISATIALALTDFFAGFFTSGFNIENKTSLVVAVIVLSLIDYTFVRVFNIQAKPFGKGLSGFVLTVIILYVTSFIVDGFNVTIIGAVVAALIYGVLSALIPGKGFFESKSSKKD